MDSILIVEDDCDIRDGLRELLASEGYLVHAACNGQEALDRLRKITKPGLILLDLSMPVMDGRQFLKAKRLDSSIADIPVIVIAGTSGYEVPKEATYFLPKPFSREVLLKLVLDWCGSGGVLSPKTVRHSSRRRA